MAGEIVRAYRTSWSYRERAVHSVEWLATLVLSSSASHDDAVLISLGRSLAPTGYHMRVAAASDRRV